MTSFGSRSGTVNPLNRPGCSPRILSTSNKQNPIPKPLVLWPGVVSLALQWLVWWGIPMVYPSAGALGVLGGLGCGLVILIWWLFFSGVRWSERLGAIVFIAIAMNT